jgi:hypothetical protein
LEHLRFIQTLVGEVISHIWFSDYSICYLELGALKAGRKLRNGRIGNPRGEFTVFLGYDWRAEIAGRSRSRLDFHAKEFERVALVTKLEGAVIRSIELMAENFEIEIGLSTDVVLRTISDKGGDPDWSIKFDKQVQGYLCIENHELKFEGLCP